MDIRCKKLKQKGYYNKKLFLSKKLDTNHRKRKIVLIHISDKGLDFRLYKTLL